MVGGGVGRVTVLVVAGDSCVALVELGGQEFLGGYGRLEGVVGAPIEVGGSDSGDEVAPCELLLLLLLLL